MRTETPRALHRFAVVLACCIVGLIAAGGLVKSLDAGLSVPDWPTSYGGLNPPRWWEIENVRAEHGHRLIAGTIAVLTIALAVFAWFREPRRWVRRLALGAVAAVLAQAVLGGITVLFFLPTAISVSHAAVAQLYLGLVVAVAVVTSSWWLEADPPRELAQTGRELRRLATGTSILIYIQILVGALVRHTGSGLAIPDFPLMFGGWWPPTLDFGIAIHLAHRLGALLVTLAIGTLCARLWGQRSRDGLVLPAVALVLLLALQVTLGAYVIWSGRAVLPNTLHVPTGAALFAVSLVIALRTRRLAGTPSAAERSAPSTVAA